METKDIYYNTAALDEIIKICNYLKDPTVRQVWTASSDARKVFEILNYEVNDGYISRKQIEVQDLGCYM